MDQDVKEIEPKTPPPTPAQPRPAAQATPTSPAGAARPTARRAGARRPLMGRLRLGQWVAIIVVVLGVVLGPGVIVGATSLSRQSDARKEIIDQLDPARTTSLELAAAIVAQQNGLRGFALNGLETNLDRPMRRRARAQGAAATAGSSA